MKQIRKPLLMLLSMIALCAIAVRVLNGSETLADYAVRNGEDTAALGPDNDSGTTPSPVAGTNSKTDASPVPNTSSQADAPPAPDTGSQTDSSPAPGADSLPASDSLSANAPNPETAPTAFTGSPELREVYQDGFWQEPLSDSLAAYISGISYPISREEAEAREGTPDAIPVTNMVDDPAALAVSYEELCYLSIRHYDFNGDIQTGELICNRSIAAELLEIFYELYQNKYPIERMRLIEEYHGDDTLSMSANNTSCFNYRVVEGTANLSKHAYGLAIDINPFYNPYVVFQKDGSTYISPRGSEIYTDRSQDFPAKIDENDLCYRLFKEHGYTWGGSWKTMKDYQHFQKS